MSFETVFSFEWVENIRVEKLIEHQLADAVRVWIPYDFGFIFIYTHLAKILGLVWVSWLDHVEDRIGLVAIFVYTRRSIVVENEPHHNSQEEVAQTSDKSKSRVRSNFWNCFQGHIEC